MKFSISQNKNIKDRLIQNKDITSLYIVFFLILTVAVIFIPQFRSPQNITNILSQMAPMGFVALGQTFVIITTGIDLSVGSVISLTTVITATQITPGDMSTVIITYLIVFGAALLIGFVNGLIISKLDLEPLIATLAVGSIVNGITLMILSHPGGYCPKCFTNAWLYEVGNVIPMSFIYFIILIIITYFILNYTRYGRRVCAIGGDEEKARITGIKIDSVKVKVYMTSSVLASFSGLALSARMRSGDPLSGASYTLYSVAAVLIGGTTFSGGKGGVVRTFAGVLILGILSVILNLLGVSPFYQNVLTGVVIILAVINSSIRKKS